MFLVAWMQYKNMICRKFTLIFSFLLLLAAPSARADIELLQWLRPQRVEPDGSGDFDRLIKLLLAEINTPVSVKVLPIQRIRRAMLAGDSVCVAPATLSVFFEKNPGVSEENYLASTPIDKVTGHVFSRPGEEPVREFKGLAGKSVAYWWRVPYGEMLRKAGLKLLYVPSEKESIQLLMAGRVDLAWGWRPGSLASYRKLTPAPANYDSDFSISSQPTQVICKYSQETKAFLRHVNQVLAAMRLDGRLKKTLMPHAQIYGVDVPFPKAK